MSRVGVVLTIPDEQLSEGSPALRRAGDLLHTLRCLGVDDPKQGTQIEPERQGHEPLDADE
ncbi:hypothetical protein ACFW3D_37680 [Streptomyces sp. NPDC058864]